MPTNRRKPVIILTFDGVLYDYDKYGWNGVNKLEGLPLEGSKQAVKELRKAYQVYIYSDRFEQLRGRKAVEEWLEKHQIDIDGIIYSLIPHYMFIGVKNKQFPRRWKEEYIEEIKELAPREG